VAEALKQRHRGNGSVDAHRLRINFIADVAREDENEAMIQSRHLRDKPIASPENRR
jgi:hypothetical protein